MAREYLAAVEHVVGRQTGMRAIPIAPDDDRSAKQSEICAAADAVDEGDGVVVDAAGARVPAHVDRMEALVSDEDVEELVAALEPDSSAAILVFEHTWAKPFRDAVVASGGVLAANFRVPGAVVDEVLAALATD